MVGTVNAERTARALEFGIYRDGDNNLDVAQSATIAQALQVSDRDASIEFSVEDTTARRGFLPAPHPAHRILHDRRRRHRPRQRAGSARYGGS